MRIHKEKKREFSLMTRMYVFLYKYRRIYIFYKKDDTHLLCRKYCFEQTFTSNTGLYILDNAIFDAQYAFLTIKVWIFGNICLPLQHLNPPRFPLNSVPGRNFFYLCL